jgi:hypothetical protein
VLLPGLFHVLLPLTDSFFSYAVIHTR